jgi:Conjugal transfer protein TraD
MRKVRDYDRELSALAERASQLKAEKVHRLGELVVATGADQVGIEALVGGLLFITGGAERGTNREAWRSAGAEFFQNGSRKTSGGPRDDGQGTGSGPAGNLQG